MKNVKRSLPLGMESRLQAVPCSNRLKPGHQISRRHGFTLLECIVYMGVLLIVMLLAFEVYERAATASGKVQRTSADIVKALQCGERWREDIRNATKEPVIIDNNQGQAIRIPQKTGFVTYVFQTNSVRRSVDGKTWKQVMPNVKTSAMQKEKREYVEAWRWEMELKTSSAVKRKTLFTFLAVPSSFVK